MLFMRRLPPQRREVVVAAGNVMGMIEVLPTQAPQIYILEFFTFEFHFQITE
jgi:hypothetical protein